MDKIRTIVVKEWLEVFRNRMVLFTVAFLPLVFVGLGLASLGGMARLGETETPTNMGELPGAAAACEGLTELECGQRFMVDIFASMFIILPVIIPVSIAAYSIVGEKLTRSLEPLLATPITTVELVAAKVIAATVPAVLATWLGYLAYVVGAGAFVSAAAHQRLYSPLWLLAILVLAPMLSLLAVSVAIMVSSRVTDPRVAEQLAGVVVLPLILVVVGQSIGLFILDARLIVPAAAVVVILDALLLYLSVRTFERETILTRWK